ncbi:hypothetical protein, partial [Photobacterium damselae]|uniref:hypothetical protein n=1 Tax=Photobacterium damselae TaxID=38293 RepID=UPI001C635F23
DRWKLRGSALGWLFVEEQAGLSRRGGRADVRSRPLRHLFRKSLIRKSQVFFRLAKTSYIYLSILNLVP